MLYPAGHSSVVRSDQRLDGSRVRRSMKGDHTTIFHGFVVRREDITRSAIQLRLIGSMSDIDAQLAATLTDTESAIGYFKGSSDRGDTFWTCYHSVKMKSRGVVAYFAHLVGENEPSLNRSWNSLTNSDDSRWSKQTVGLVAFSLLIRIRPLLHNEKSTAEADCILKHGPIVRGGAHPFVLCGATRLRRGVWRWPDLGGSNALVEKGSNQSRTSHSD